MYNNLCFLSLKKEEIALTESEKIMIAGCAAGAAAAAVPTVYGFIKASAAAKPIVDSDFLHTENASFVNEKGIETPLRGVNLNDDIFYPFFANCFFMTTFTLFSTDTFIISVFLRAYF